MSLAGGGTSSSRAAPSNTADGGGGEGTSEPPPDTICKTKVKWTWQRFDRTDVGAVRRSLTLDVHDADQVKGDDNMQETPITEKEASLLGPNRPRTKVGCRKICCGPTT